MQNPSFSDCLRIPKIAELFNGKHCRRCGSDNIAVAVREAFDMLEQRVFKSRCGYCENEITMPLTFEELYYADWRR